MLISKGTYGANLVLSNEYQVIICQFILTSNFVWLSQAVAKMSADEVDASGATGKECKACKIFLLIWGNVIVRYDRSISLDIDI